MKVAAIQLCSQIDPAPNLSKIRSFLKEIQLAKIQYVFLPECFYSLSDGLQHTPYAVQEGNQHFEAIRDLARDFQVYLLGGSVAYAPSSGEKHFNRSYQFDPQGKVLAYYDKRHLFSFRSKKIDEGILYQAGSDFCQVQIGPMNLGVHICYDLRFPEDARHNISRGANVLSYSSAFTVPTGEAHWHTLLRARAIENQCYVIAAAQWGQNNHRIETYGHSLIVDPWGKILAELPHGEGWISAPLDFPYLSKVRDTF